MARKSVDDLGRLQKAVMDVLWDEGEATGRDVQTRLGGREKFAYTTILTILQRLEKAGWVKHRREGKTHVFSATHSREQERSRCLKNIIDLVFQGDAQLLFQHLVEFKNLRDEDLKALRKVIDKKRREKSNE